MKNKIWDKTYLKKISKLNISKKKINKRNLSIAYGILVFLFAGHLLFKNNLEKKPTIKFDRSKLELRSVDSNGKFYTLPYPVIDSPSTYFILENKPTKYPNLEVIAEYYPKSEPFIPMIENSIEEHKNIFHLDPLAVLILMNAESGCNPKAISRAGAAGLMQLIPETAKEMGLKIHEIDIYDNLKKARKNMNEAYSSVLRAVWRENNKELIKLSKELHFYARKVNSLFREYKKTLLENKDLDERLDPEKNIWAGVKYLATLARLNMEDENIANLINVIAAYNYRGEDAAREWILPTIRQPIGLANKVIEAFIEIRHRAIQSPIVYVE